MSVAHLVESTLLLGLAIAAAHLPRLAARTRYAIVFLALVKFAVPWKFQTPHGTIAISIPGPIAVAPHAFAATSPWPAVLNAVWLAVAAALFLVIVWRAHRAVAEALEGVMPAPEREQALLPRRDVVLLRSPGAGAPAAIGIFRPRIVLPATLDLGDDELAAILAHECAHVARRDNLLALIDAAFGAALWFHPLVWLARRILARAREEACDEIVVARGGTEVYVNALAQVCRAAASPRVAGVSCIVSNTIRERMNAIMTLSIRRPLPHRLVVAAAVALLAAASLLHAAEKTNHYKMELGVSKSGDTMYVLDITVREIANDAVVAHQIVNTSPGADGEANDGKFKVHTHAGTDGRGTVRLEVWEGGKLTDSVLATYTIKEQKSSTSSNKISLDLKDADLRDVIRTFGQLTSLEPKIDAGVEGKVDVEFHDVPWDQALQHILLANGCDYQIEGGTLHVRRTR